MRIKGPFYLICTVALAACAGPLPDSNPDTVRGVGFDDYSTYRRATEARTPDTVAITVNPRRISEETARDEPAAIAGEAMAALGTAPVLTETLDDPAPSAAPASAPLQGAGAPLDARRPGLSDEQSFEAVAARETIESDAERIARQRAALEVVEPTALPDRTDADGPNIVQYALSTTNGVGQQVYNRGPFASVGRAQRICARFSSDEMAQEAFIAEGGPQRDRMGIDPDGDGFACGWDPAPFRRAAAAARN